MLPRPTPILLRYSTPICSRTFSRWLTVRDGFIPCGRVLKAFLDAKCWRIVTWGAMVYTAAEAAEIVAEDEISVEALDLRT